MDRAALADFLLNRRNGLQPADVGLAVGVRRRAPGLRREEVAALLAFLLSEEAGWITAATYDINGGLHIS